MVSLVVDGKTDLAQWRTQQSAGEPLGLPSVSRRAGPPKLRVLLVSPLGRVVERMCPNGGQNKAPEKPLGFPRFPVGPGGHSASTLVVLLVSQGTAGRETFFLLCWDLYPLRRTSADVSSSFFYVDFFTATVSVVTSMQARRSNARIWPFGISAARRRVPTRRASLTIPDASPTEETDMPKGGHDKALGSRGAASVSVKPGGFFYLGTWFYSSRSESERPEGPLPSML